MIRMLFNNGIKYDSRLYSESQNPFLISIRCRKVDCLRELLHHTELGTSNSSDTSIMKSIRINQPETIPLLLESGDNPDKFVFNPIRKEYESALSLACKAQINGKEEVVKLLLENINKVDLDRSIESPSAVHWICESRSPVICKLVLEKGIDVNRFDQNGCSGPQRLTDCRDEDVVIEILQLLIAFGYDMNLVSKNDNSKPILVHFCQSIVPSLRVIDWMLQNGADPYLPFKEHNLEKTPFDIARNKFKLRPIFMKYVNK
ncbi:ankyrin repeat-containing protein [Tritrichomonas foetus]|uniref:Ankyrin repeat-containing protein n=1 Tax=Tritrichomonas foetus TaxID=1144522 RepID=A0A1J4K4L4_9EUKA|nr:ankyrin repeat-containing protein [Tritrichomonas foetus]|eukprot:OHT04692.1 ankyrin repeat-containing protein [Tritrichomonas foetus]